MTTATVPLIEPGQTLEDTAHGPLVIAAVRQRNWSRVGVAQMPGSARPVYFLKQFVAADGHVLDGGAAAEGQAATLGRAVFGDCVLVPEFADESRALLAYPHLQFRATDELLRDDSRKLEGVWEEFCADIAGLIAAAEQAPAELLRGLRELAPSTSGQRALAFKAFEVRNIAPRIDGTQPLLVFDLGPAYVSTVIDVVSRLLVSVLLLNWGRPMSRFVQGPPTDLATRAVKAWPAALDAETVAKALTKEVAMRRTAIQASSRRERWAKSAGLSTVGRRYEAKALHWVRRTLS
jgi:hypothetical protein